MSKLSASRWLLSLSFLFASLAAVERAEALDWRATHGINANAFQKFVDDISKAGMRLEFVQGYDAGGSPQFAAVAVKDGLEWEARHGLDRAGYQKAFDQFARDGYRLQCVSGYRDGQNTRFAGVWVKGGENVGWRARHGIAAGDSEQAFSDGVKDGYMPVHAEGSSTGNGNQFCFIFQQRPGVLWYSRYDLTADDYQRLFNEQTAKGLRPLTVSGYLTPDGVRFATVFIKDDQPFVGRHNLTADQYQAAFNDAANNGLRPTCISGYYDGKQVRYAAVFAKDQPTLKLKLDYPVSGPAVAYMSPVDAAMIKYMQTRSITAGTLAISRHGKIVYSRGFGWADVTRTQTIAPDASFRIASLVKAMTAACIYKLEREGKLKLSDNPFTYLTDNAPPAGKKVDDRVKDITIEHVLFHKGGWDVKARKYDPMFESIRISKDLGLSGPPSPNQTINWMLGQPLDFDPGAREAYSNFGYCVLGRVIEKVSGKKYVDYLREEIMLPLDAGTIRLAHTRFKQADEPVYLSMHRGRDVMQPNKDLTVDSPYGAFYIETMDAHGGLLSSAPDLCKFLNQYWITGRPRRRGESENWGFFGSLPGTFTCNVQRDGIVWAALFNQRDDSSGANYDDIMKEMNAAIDAVKWPEIIRER